MKATASSIKMALRWRVAVSDRAFDRIFPREVRERSSVHWTPVSIAVKAATWLMPQAGMRVLDVGAGPGKVCCIGALVRGGRWHGIERDAELVDVARETAELFALQKDTTFSAGEMDTVQWSDYDGFYLYNPFAAILFGPAPFESKVRLRMLMEQIARTEELLAGLREGTRVVTYEGFGGAMPDGYTVANVERFGDTQLTLWIMQRSQRRRVGFGKLARRNVEPSNDWRK